MARVLLARSDAESLSNLEPIPLSMALQTGEFSYSQPLRLYTQFPREDFELEFMFVPVPPIAEGAEVYQTLEWYLEYYDDSMLLNDPLAEDPPSAEELQNVQDQMAWVEDTLEVPAAERGCTDFVTNLRTVRVGSYHPVNAKVSAQHLWTRIRYRLQSALEVPQELWIWAHAGGFAEESFLETLALPYAYEAPPS